ncbi:MAG: DUF885 domain-containing protein [Eubacteriales bacterium]|nr:DUF885 domain-containing protein [Eubacteriales bacterium]
MRTFGKRTLGAILVLLILTAVLLTKCFLPREDSSATTATPYEESSPDSYEQYSEQQMKAQEEFDALTEEVFRKEAGTEQLSMHFLMKDPSVYGINEAEYLYAPVTEAFLEESRNERRDLEDRLSRFETALLTDQQKLTMRVLQSRLRTEAMADGLELYAQPLSTTIGVQSQLPILLCEYAFYDKQDVEDYLKLLDGIDDYYQQIMEFEKKKADAGLMMSDTSIDHVIESCESYLLVPGDNFMIDTFNARLEAVPYLTDEEKEEYRKKNVALLDTAFLPAYQGLIDGLTALKGTGTNEKGLCEYPDGKKYYKYLVYSQTGTSYDSIPELLSAIEKSMNDRLMETSEMLKNNPSLVEEFEHYQFRLTEPEAIMEDLKAQTADSFPALPACSYTFKDVPKALELSLSPAFYLTSPIDDYQNNVIYINRNPRYESTDFYNLIAHEGYPGHLYQNVYSHVNDSCSLRKVLTFPGYTEGWASYVEQLAYSLDNGLEPEMAKMLAANSMASLGLHACLDIYINYSGWDKAQVRDYLKNFYSQPDEVVENIYYSMIENPGNYLSYYVGCMEFMNMRKTAEKELGDRFDEKAFHTFLLDMGDAPFDVIQSYFSSWLVKQKL